MTMIEFADGWLSFDYTVDTPKMTIMLKGKIPHIYHLDHEEVMSLIKTLERIEEQMRPWTKVMKEARGMAEALHDAGWDFKRFSDAIYPMGRVTTQGILNEVGEELSRLDKEGGQ